MSSKSLEKTSKSSRVVKLPQISTEEQLLGLGAVRDGYGMKYENPALGVIVYWRRLLNERNESLEATNLYVFSHQEPMKKSTLH